MANETDTNATTTEGPGEAGLRTRRPRATEKRENIKSLPVLRDWRPGDMVALTPAVPETESKAVFAKNVARKGYSENKTRAEQSHAWHLWLAVYRALNKRPNRTATMGELGDAAYQHFKRARNPDGTPRDCPEGYEIGREVKVLIERGALQYVGHNDETASE